MIKRTELLVHAGAPSSRKDDERYRAQAETYSRFQGYRIDLTEPSRPASLIRRQDETTMVESPAIFWDDTQLAITGLESQLLTSSLLIASGAALVGSEAFQKSSGPDSLPLVAREVADDGGRTTKHALLDQIRSFGKRKKDDGLSEVALPRHNDAPHDAGGTAARNRSHSRDESSSAAHSWSSYLKTPVLDRSVKKRRLEEKDGQVTIVALPPFIATSGGIYGDAAWKGNSAITAAAPATTAPAAVSRSQGSLAISQQTSELPTSYSLSDITSESSRARVGTFQRSASDPGAADPPPGRPEASTASASSSDSAANVHPTALALPKNARPDAPAQVVVVIPDDTQDEGSFSATRHKPAVCDRADKGLDANPRSPTFKSSRNQNLASAKPPQSPTASQLQALRTLSTSIHPPEPQVSLKPFATHITPALASLAASKDMDGRYQPASISREIRQLERGYWRFDTSEWNTDLQVHFWQFLEKAIGNGNPGWGVWCTRECEGRANGLGVGKLYCWGEVVQHAYLLLYVASKSQIRKVSARWLDAEDAVVVRMKQIVA